MSKRSVIGIPLRRCGQPGPAYGQLTSYFDAVARAGGVPLGIPQGLDEDAVRTLYDRCDGIVLAGGPDVEPQRYGAEPDPACGLDVEPSLDALDFALARWALADERPLLAICRGLQVLNVAMGGTLWQDLMLQRPGSHEHRRRDQRSSFVHTVSVEARSALHGLVGSDELRVNSVHHQGIRDLAPGLRAVATAPDGLVEAVEIPGRRYLVGVQWHPEELAGEPAAAALFTGLVAATHLLPA